MARAYNGTNGAVRVASNGSLSGLLAKPSGINGSYTRKEFDKLLQSDNPQLGKIAMDRVNATLDLHREYKTSDLAAKAFARVAQAITNDLPVEILAKIFKLPDGMYVLGTPFSNGNRVSVSPVSFTDAPGAVQTGYVHTHTSNATIDRLALDGNDANQARIDTKATNIKQTWYTSLPNGNLFAGKITSLEPYKATLRQVH